MISSACCNDPRSSSGFCQTSKRSFNSDETAVVTRIAVRAPLTTDDDDERRTIQDGRQSRSYIAARNMPSLRWADTGPAIRSCDSVTRPLLVSCLCLAGPCLVAAALPGWRLAGWAWPWLAGAGPGWLGPALAAHTAHTHKTHIQGAHGAAPRCR